MVDDVRSTPPSGDPVALVLETLAEAPSEPDFVSDAPLVAFDAFLVDRRVFGWMRLGADRLTDVLNAQRRLVLHNVQLAGLPDGRLEVHDELVLERDDLLAVRAGGPRGDPARRVHLRRHPLIVRTGPYVIGGFLHAPPGVEPREDLELRAPMVPLSLGSLELWDDGHRRAQWSGTIVFNRALVDAIEVVQEEDLGFDTMRYGSIAGTGRPG